MKTYILIFSYISLLLACSGCMQHSGTTDIEYLYIEPDYGKVDIAPTGDSIAFPLDETTYNKIKNFNLFTDVHNEKFISFYDKRSISINIYHFASKKKVARMELKNLFSKLEAKKISAYVHNFDSIFINTSKGLVLIDSTGKKLQSIKFLKHPKYAWAEFEITAPPFFSDGHLYTSVSPYVNAKSRSAIKNWRIIYDFDLRQGTAQLLYRLPPAYNHQLDGRIYFNHSYCINDKGHFVLSFAIDSCIYETDLQEYHKAYLGKSHRHKDPITMGSEKADSTFRLKYKKFFSNDTYSSIYYDPYKKRYLRMMYGKLSKAELAAGEKTKKLSMIIFNEHFKIIGESDIPAGISTSAMFFSPDGKIYARVNVNDPNQLQFVRLRYSDEDKLSTTLSYHK